jgi:tetratricopeptide (TPR) repeat protein
VNAWKSYLNAEDWEKTMFMNRKNLLVVLSLASTALTGHAYAQTREQNWAQCDKTSDPDPAIAACTSIIQSGMETTESLAQIYHSRGASYRYKGELGNGDKSFYNLAFRDFDEAIRLKPSYHEAYTIRGMTFNEIGEYDRAIKDYDTAIQLVPASKSGFYLVLRATTYRNMGKYDRALQDLDQMMQLSPQRAVEIAFGQRCEVNALAGRFEVALVDCNKRIDADHSASAYDHLGFLYLKMREAGKAITAYNTALAKDASYAPSLYGRGEAELMLNNPRAAKADMDAARRIDARIDATFVKVFKFPPAP